MKLFDTLFLLIAATALYGAICGHMQCIVEIAICIASLYACACAREYDRKDKGGSLR